MNEVTQKDETDQSKLVLKKSNNETKTEEIKENALNFKPQENIKNAERSADKGQNFMFGFNNNFFGMSFGMNGMNDLNAQIQNYVNKEISDALGDIDYSYNMVNNNNRVINNIIINNAGNKVCIMLIILSIEIGMSLLIILILMI